MGALLGRRHRVQVGDVEVTDHDVRFRIERTARIEVNTAEVEITNLGPDTRARLANIAPFAVATEYRQLTLEAGYRDDFGLIFQGDVTRVSSDHPGTEWLTVVEAGDGEAAMRTSFTVASLPPGSSVGDLMAQIVGDMGVAGEKVVARLKARDFPGAIKELQRGFAAADHSADLLREVGAITGLDLSIQNGEVIALAPGETTSDPPLLLAADSGLSGAPRRAEGGVVLARALLHPGIHPGRRIVLQSSVTQGDFVVGRVVYTGDTTANDDWTAEMELWPL